MEQKETTKMVCTYVCTYQKMMVCANDGIWQSKIKKYLCYLCTLNRSKLITTNIENIVKGMSLQLFTSLIMNQYCYGNELNQIHSELLLF